MTDLFQSMEEAVEERLAIQEADDIFDEDERHRCEVSWVVRAFYPDNVAAADYFALVEQKRNKEAADRLRADCRIEWMKRKAQG
jgi:hypothetical protein